ncbi:MAG TPA: M24 family metallopeptidase [Actinoplanes sp.]|jgi:Xaa-Pro aminopeptidase
MTNGLFTMHDYIRRMDRAAVQAAQAGFAGVLVTPGPDLAYFTGYQPTAVTERLTLLILDADREPVMMVPALERPDVERAPGAPAVALFDWADGEDPYAALAPLLDPLGHYVISDSAWAMHLLGLQRSVPGSCYSAMTSALPMLRAIKDADEVSRLAAAGAAADAAYEEIVRVRFAGRREREIGADLAGFLREHGHSQVDFTIVGSGPNGANPHHEMGERIVQNGDMVILDFGGDGHRGRRSAAQQHRARNAARLVSVPS